MHLVILAQNLKSISVALFDNGLVCEHKDIQVAPESYLRSIDNALVEWKISLNEIKGVVVVTGPGSFTSSRVSTTIANALAFSRGIPIFTIENPNNFTLDSLFKSIDLSLFSSVPFAFPCYNSPAHITKPKYCWG